MSISQQSQPRTRMFARVLGPFIVVIATIVAVRAPHMATLLAQFTATEVWPWVVGAFILMGGIAIVAFHQYWRSPAAVIASVFGWLLIVRGGLPVGVPRRVHLTGQPHDRCGGLLADRLRRHGTDRAVSDLRGMDARVGPEGRQRACRCQPPTAFRITQSWSTHLNRGAVSCR
jgi:hypothetical protein